jgi:hypothetical protein
MNLCTGYGQDFASVTAFDAHRVGKFPQTGPAEYQDRRSRGLVPLDEDWKPEHGRRCLDTNEMLAVGWRKDRRGRWQHPRRILEPARIAASEPAYSLQEATRSGGDTSDHARERNPRQARLETRDSSCAICGAGLARGARGPAGIYCSPACRKRAERQRAAA